ncbi:YheC/YheD family protein [Bacillus sp. JJ1532]|uniref:YheC/YheD family protein n=1 Tax=unclassified Bacillus (in: firmicutes) TaxID=185979 RepID=UPI002FFFCA3D
MGRNGGKWIIHRVLRDEKLLSEHLPETQLLTEESLWELLDRHRVVIVKPCMGRFGYGVIQVSKLGEDHFQIHNQAKKITFSSRDQTYRYLMDQKPKRKYYVVQQKIPLAHIDGNPFDIRVMVQRRKGSTEWNVTGKVCKVAAEHFIVTNVAREVLTIEEASFRSSLFEVPLQFILSEIDRVSLLTSVTLGNYYSSQLTFGLDVGCDQKGHIWIIEVNLAPSIVPFRLLKDKSMLRKIKSFYKR